MVTTNPTKRNPIAKPKTNPSREVETYRSIKDGEVKLTAKEKKMAELVRKAIS